MASLEYDLRPAVEESSQLIAGVVTGTLIGFVDDGRTPLVTYPERTGTSAVPARSVVDLHGAHIGSDVVLMFDRGDPKYPIVLGYLRQDAASPLPVHPGQVDVDIDGQRLVVTAKDRLVLRCGKASITLTKAGKILIDGAYLLARSSGVNRIKGGSVHIN